jgi:16S rRNA (guanine527-N7)-methyltransferase
VTFTSELLALLPADLPHRDAVVAGAARHLELIDETNRHFNLTRIVEPREAAIKHVVDSVSPWRLFADAGDVTDAGSGAGFPGIPLALVLPEVRFTLLESTQKKARFIESVIDELALPNVTVAAERAEDWLKIHRAEIVTARAVAPLDRALVLFAACVRKGGRVLLYKGPDAEAEVAGAERRAAKLGWRVRIVERYELPDAAGARAIVEVSR